MRTIVRKVLSIVVAFLLLFGVNIANVSFVHGDDIITKNDLTNLVDQVKSYQSDMFAGVGWGPFKEALYSAQEVVAKTDALTSEIELAYSELDAVIRALHASFTPLATPKSDSNTTLTEVTDDTGILAIPSGVTGLTAYKAENIVSNQKISLTAIDKNLVEYTRLFMYIRAEGLTGSTVMRLQVMSNVLWNEAPVSFDVTVTNGKWILLTLDLTGSKLSDFMDGTKQVGGYSLWTNFTCSTLYVSGVYAVKQLASDEASRLVGTTRLNMVQSPELESLNAPDAPVGIEQYSLYKAENVQNNQKISMTANDKNLQNHDRLFMYVRAEGLASGTTLRLQVMSPPNWNDTPVFFDVPLTNGKWALVSIDLKGTKLQDYVNGTKQVGGYALWTTFTCEKLYISDLYGTKVTMAKPDSGAFSSASPLIRTDRIQNVTCLTNNIRAYEKVEFELNMTGITGNVFDPDHVSLEMDLASNSGAKLNSIGFYYEPYAWNSDGSIGAKSGESTWRFRFTPTAAGTWDFKITLKENKTVVDTIYHYINVKAAADTRGFVRVEPAKKQNFTFDNGMPYIAIGENVAWSVPATQPAYAAKYFKSVYTKLADNGANYARTWMANWDLCFLSKRVPPSILSTSKAAQLDQIVDYLDLKDMYISLVVYHHGQFSVDNNPDWANCAYNAATGYGYLNSPGEFFTNTQAKKDAKILLRYLVARYGYSPNIMSWELFNEVDGTDGAMEDILPWHEEMNAYLRSFDSYGHMISTSCAYNTNPLATNTIFDFATLHWYNYNGVKNLINKQKNTYSSKHFPVMFGEVGDIGTGITSVDSDFVNIHQQNWAGAMGGGAGTAMNWFYEGMESLNGYFEYRAVSSFLKWIPWKDSGRNTASTSLMNGNNSRVEITGYYNGQNYAYLWLFDNQYSHLNKVETSFTQYTFSVPMNDGTYTVKWVDTHTGLTTQTDNVTAANGSLAVTAPIWNCDIAVAITPIN